MGWARHRSVDRSRTARDSLARSSYSDAVARPPLGGMLKNRVDVYDDRMAEHQAIPNAPAGWYPESGRLRYWDGQTWTEHFASPREVARQSPAPRVETMSIRLALGARPGKKKLQKLLEQGWVIASQDHRGALAWSPGQSDIVLTRTTYK